MRRANAILTAMILLLFLIHMLWGVLILCGWKAGGSMVFSCLGGVMLLLILFHVLISLKFTADTLRACKRSGVSYWRENRLFWIRRISGLAVMFFLICHVYVFSGRTVNGVFLLRVFDVAALVSQLLLVLALLVHILTNIGPLRLSFGLEDNGNLRTDLLLILAVLLLVAGIAFAVYFIRWNIR